MLRNGFHLEPEVVPGDIECFRDAAFWLPLELEDLFKDFEDKKLGLSVGA